MMYDVYLLFCVSMMYDVCLLFCVSMMYDVFLFVLAFSFVLA